MLQYPWNPHTSTYHYVESRVTYTNFESAKAQVEVRLKNRFTHFRAYMIDDLMHLSVQNSLLNTSDSDTQALARKRIPSSATHDHTLRFLIAFQYEIQKDFEAMLDYSAKHAILGGPGNYIVSSFPRLDSWFNRLTSRADKIVELMDGISNKLSGGVTQDSGGITQDADFIREAALIELGEKTGVQLTTAGNDILFGLRDPGSNDPSGNLMQYALKANQTWHLTHFESLRYTARKNNATDTATMTAKNGPVELNINNVKSVLAKDASKTFTVSELTPGPNKNISVLPILIPTVQRELADISDLEVAEVESHNLANLFGGLRVSVTASSVDPSIATVSVNSEGTSCGVTGVGVGTTTITVTGTNPAGSATASFDVTVVAAS